MADIKTLSDALAGIVSPFVTQVIRDRWLKVNDQGAHWLSLGVAAGCVLVAAWVNHGPWDVTTLGADVGLAFTLSQVVYHNFLRDSDNGRDAAADLTKTPDAPVVVPVEKDTPHP